MPNHSIQVNKQKTTPVPNCAKSLLYFDYRVPLLHLASFLFFSNCNNYIHVIVDALGGFIIVVTIYSELPTPVPTDSNLTPLVRVVWILPHYVPLDSKKQPHFPIDSY